jgi:FkbM family methyltransferase
MPSLSDRVAHFVLKKLGLFNRRYKETAFGREFVIPIINGRKTYVSEPWMAEVIAKLFSIAPGAFIDVGVNLGQTLLKVGGLSPEREYLGFEPNPACADYAAQLALVNKLPYIVIPAGLGSRTTVLQLQIYRNEDTDPSASLVEGFRENVVGTKTVVTIALEHLPPKLVPDEIAIIKIDVEGGEADVISAVRPLLETKRPFLLLEILPVYSADNYSRLGNQKDIENTVRESGYTMFRILRDNAENFERLDRIDEIGVHGSLNLSDYLFAPSEKIPALAHVFGSSLSGQERAALERTPGMPAKVDHPR